MKVSNPFYCLLTRLISKKRDKTVAQLYDIYFNTLHENMAVVPELSAIGLAEIIKVQDIFIPLTLREAYSEPVFGNKSTRLMDVESAVEKYNYLLIMGVLGSGKTLLLRRLILKYCEENVRLLSLKNKKESWNVEVPYSPLIPIPVILREFVQSGKDLRHYIGTVFEKYGFSGARIYLEEDLNAGKCILLIDGLDELPSFFSRDEAIICIRNFISEYSNIKIIVTSRFAGYYEELTGFMRLEVDSLDKNQRIGFIKKWFERLALSSSDVLINILEDTEDLEELTRNPLFLSVVVSIFFRAGELIPKRVEIYRQIVDLILSKWEEKKSIGNRFSYEKKQFILSKLALKNQLRGRRTIPEKEILGEIDRFSQSLILEEEDHKAFFYEIWQRNCILKRIFSDNFDFIYLTFQDFFAALEISKQGSDITNLISHLYEPGWENSIRLYAGICDDINFLVKKIREVPEDIFFTNLMITGKCIAESENVDPFLKDEIVHELWMLYTGSEYSLLKENAIKVLAQMKPRRIIDFLVNQLTDKESIIRRSAVASLGQIKCIEILPSLIMVLMKDRDSKVREQAAQAIGELGSIDSIPALFNIINTDLDSDVRKGAADALGSIGLVDTIPELLDVLNWETDNKVRSSIAEVLGMFPGPIVVDELIRRLNSEKDSSVRWRIVLALGKAGGKEAREILIEALSSDKQQEVRESAAEALALIGEQECIQPLIRALTVDKEAEVRGSAAYALGVMRSNEALPELVRTLIGDMNGEVRGRAAYALGRLRNIEAIPYLSLAFSTQRTSFIRGNAAWALGEIGGADAISFITQVLLVDQDSYVRFRAAEVLGTIGNSATIPPLMAALNDEGNYYGWKVKNKAFESLEKLSKRLQKRILKN